METAPTETPSASAAAPALRLIALSVHVPVAARAPSMLAAPRDLPDLARTLFHALVPHSARDAPVLDAVSLELAASTCAALVGETRSGKTSLARTCARLLSPASGRVEVDGIDVHRARGRELRAVRRALQVTFDDAEAALDPLCTVERALSLADVALALPTATRDARHATALARVGLDPAVVVERAGALPASARRRVALARALLPEPSVLVLDEPAGGLDPAGRAGVLAALEQVLRAPAAPALLLLTKDLAAARRLASVVGVLHRGAVVECGAAERVLTAPEHPYARALVKAWPWRTHHDGIHGSRHEAG